MCDSGLGLSASTPITPQGYVRPSRPTRAARHDLREGAVAIIGHHGILGLFSLMLFGNALKATVICMLPNFSDRGLHVGVKAIRPRWPRWASAPRFPRCGARRLTVGAITWGVHGLPRCNSRADGGDVAALGECPLDGPGFCFKLCRTGTVALLQTSVPDHLRGRMTSMQFLLQHGASAFGVAVIVGVAEVWGLRVPVLCGVALAIPVWLVTYRVRGRMRAAFVPAL